METSMMISITIIFLIILSYIKPLIIHRLKTRKVRVVVIDKFGHKKTNTLYLYPDDPLWKVIETHKGDKHA
ncbi:hypothetical protein D3C77_659630 [compost metagenome]